MAIVLDGTTGITTPDLTDTSLTSGRVVYAGTSGNLTGSANLTFDGSNLICGGTLQALGTVQSSSGADLSLNANGSNRDVFVKVNGTTLMTVQGSTGRVGIGTATPNAKFTVSNSGVEALEFSPTGSTAGGAYIQGYNRTSFVYIPVEIIASSFAVYPQGGASKVNVNFNGLGLGTGTPSSGIGITFPATQDPSSNANTLDDYEEGTWTPTDGSGVGLSITFNNPKYTKIGRLVYVSADTIVYPATSNTSAASIAGLPFSNLAANVASGALVSANAFANRSLVLGSATSIFIYATATQTQSTNAQLSSATIYGFSAVYQTS